MNYLKNSLSLTQKGRMMRTFSLIALACVSFLTGCADPVEQINTVQPHFVEKSLFEGEWYYRKTIVDVAPEFSIGHVGLEATLEKITWEITEDTLIARRSFEPIEGLEADSTLEGADYVGEPVGMWSISSHFDVQRGYNAATGEKTNVTVENTTDRPWYERQYMRVNWASNLFNYDVDLGIARLSKRQNGSQDYIRETEALDPDHLVLTDDYISLTTRAILSDNGRTCYFTYGNGNCGSAETRVRWSFAKIDQDEAAEYFPRNYADNEPMRDAEGRILRTVDVSVGRGESKRIEFACTPDFLERLDEVAYPGYRTFDDCRELRSSLFERGGMFRTERYRYDRRLGAGHQAGRTQYANLHQIWDNPRSMEPFEDANGDEIYNGPEPWTDANGNQLFDDGEDFDDLDANGEWNPGESFTDYNENGRRDDIYVATPGYLLEPRPIVYYLNANFPQDLERVIGEMSNEWDAAFIGAAAARVGVVAVDEMSRHCKARLNRERAACLAGGNSTDDCKVDLSACNDVAKDIKRGADDIRELLSARFDQARNDQDWSFLASDTLKQSAVFQIHKNLCSAEGIQHYIENNTVMKAVMDEALGGDDLSPGNIARVCANLRWHSMGSQGNKTIIADVDPFDWQQIGDVRFSFVDWVNEPQPSGPLGYGPSSADPETGRILSGSAHIYGAAIDTRARSAADIVRAMNEDLDLNTLISGASYAEWLETSVSVADMEVEIDENRLTALAGNFDAEQAYGKFKLPGGGIDKAALRLNWERREKHMHPDDPMTSVLEAPLDEGRKRLDRLRQNPLFRSRMLTNEYQALVRPLYGLDHDDPLTVEAEEAAIDMAYDPAAFQDRQQERLAYFADKNIFMADFIDDSVIGLALRMKGLDPDEVYRRMREEIFRATTLHEIGHTVGMSHNFEGSYDALNYQDEFWQIRNDLPKEEWAENGLSEYRYSTIMDYSSRFNTDMQGLGKYDLATIKLAYGHTTEEFAGFEMTEDLSYDVLVDGYEGIPEYLGGDYKNITKRKDRSYESLREERKKGVLSNARVFARNPNALLDSYWIGREVPYSYCYDIFRGNLRCKTWDEGASQEEVVRASIQNYWNYYAFNNYRRGRSESSFINSYLGRQAWLGAYLRDPFRYYYFYRNYSINLRDDMYKAASIGLNFINQVLGTPVTGRHCFDAERNLYVPFEQFTGPECQVLDVPNGTGREETLGLNDEFYNKIDYIGSYYDKMNFLALLNDTSSRFFGVTNIANNRAFSIGFYRIFQPEMLKLSRDMMMSWLSEDDGETFNSLVVNNGPNELVIPRAFVEREAFGQGEEMEGVPRIQASVPYNLMWQSLLLSTIRNTSTYDNQLDFDEYLAISETGSGDDRTYPDDWDVASYTDPQTGVNFRAAQTKDNLSISYELLTRAQLYVEETLNPAREALESDPENAGLVSDYQRATDRIGEFNDLISDLRLLRSAVDTSED